MTESSCSNSARRASSSSDDSLGPTDCFVCSNVATLRSISASTFFDIGRMSSQRSLVIHDQSKCDYVRGLPHYVGLANQPAYYHHQHTHKKKKMPFPSSGFSFSFGGPPPPPPPPPGPPGGGSSIAPRCEFALLFLKCKRHNIVVATLIKKTGLQYIPKSTPYSNNLSTKVRITISPTWPLGAQIHTMGGI